MIKFTLHDTGLSLYVNPSDVSAARRRKSIPEDGTIVYLNYAYFEVKESLGTVLKQLGWSFDEEA